jgi:uncharacterized membrane protein
MSGNGAFPFGIFAVLTWGVLILFTIGYLAQRSFSFLKLHTTGQNRNRYDPLEILKARYTKGEISGEEFTKINNILVAPE